MPSNCLIQIDRPNVKHYVNTTEMQKIYPYSADVETLEWYD